MLFTEINAAAAATTTGKQLMNNLNDFFLPARVRLHYQLLPVKP